MNLPLDSWTVLPAVLVLTVALLSRTLRSHGSWSIQISARWVPVLVATPIFLGLWVYEGRFQPIPFSFGVLFGLVESRRPEPAPDHPTVGRHVSIPLVLGAISAGLTFWIWSGKDFAPQFHDESAYLLQAGIFAEGRWTDPSPPLPEFFEQFHVLVVPARAAKYPPGHAITITPGVVLGFPAAVPLLLVAGTGSLLFVLTRRLAGNAAAIFAWLVWTTAPGLFGLRSSYFSEVTTSFLWLAIWWAVLRWKDTGRSLWLGAAAFGSSWGAITRPLTMLLFIIPLVVAISRPLIRRRNPRELMLAAIAGVIPLLLLPLWSLQTVGRLSTSPLGVYTRAYMPFDRVGFGLDVRAPERPLPDCMRDLSRAFMRIHRDHEPATLPHALAERVTAVLRDVFAGPRSLLFAFALLGATRLPREGKFAAVTAVLLLLGYLVYAHYSAWSIYYLEAQTVLAALAGIGLSTALRSLPDGLARIVGVLLIVAIAVMFLLDASEARAQARRLGRHSVQLHAALASLDKSGPGVVFVRCRPGGDPRESLVQNGPDLANARLWLVHDRGEQNSRLWSLVPDRRAFLYDESRGLLEEIRKLPDASSTAGGDLGEPGRSRSSARSEDLF
jgi:hypothetical protein